MEEKDKEIEIIHLEFPDNIRTRSGMFIGSTDNPDIILREVIDNSIDELFNCNHANKINIDTKSFDEWSVISDNGRGIPIQWDSEKEMTKAQMASSLVNAGSKFNKIGTVAVGLNGVGIKATNALSNRFVILSKITESNYKESIPEVESTYNQLAGTDELFYVLEYAKGIKIFEGGLAKTTIVEKYSIDFPAGMSTIVAFQPDDTIFTTVRSSYPKKNLYYLKTIFNKFYNKDISVILNGVEVANEFVPYKFEFLSEIISQKTKDKIRFYITFDVDTNMNVTDYAGSVNSLVVDRGVHIDRARECYWSALKSKFGIEHDYITNGLKMLVIVLAGEVDFSSQTKERLVYLSGAKYEDCEPIRSEFKRIFRANEQYFKEHVDRLNAYAESLTKISTITKIKNTIAMSSEMGDKIRSKVPKNVLDASSANRKECELLIIEGKSAGTQLRKKRDSKTQAIFFLRGKPLNAINADLDTLFANEEMKNIIIAIGCGVNEVHSLENPRYDKVILCADADPDGLYISSLMVGMFAKKMSFLIRNRMVYVLKAPLYKQNGKYYYLGDDMSDFDKTKPFKRFKGLGEMSEEEVKECIVNKETRRLTCITEEQVQYALELLTSTTARKNLMIERGVLVDKYNVGEL